MYNQTMKHFIKDNHPRCVAFVHRAMGTMDTCGKYADWIISNTLPTCRDCVAKVLINMGDKIDDISFDIIIITK